MNEFEIAPFKLESGAFYILDQTKLPASEEYLQIKSKEDIYDAIFNLKVRGAPAIGVAAAYGLWVSTEEIDAENFPDFFSAFLKIKDYIGAARPTAVNLGWALERIEKRLVEIGDELNHQVEGNTQDEINPRGEANFSKVKIRKIIFEEAEKIRMEDEAACYAMGEFGLSLLKPGMGILTHCNAGTIATSKYGTCLAPVYLGTAREYDFKVFADETRPLLQGARLTAWELQKAGIDVTLICDNMASIVMKNGWIDAVVVGCDRLAANGDGANKIGTSGVAILAKEYGIPFYMYVPTSTIDLLTPTGADIKIEERSGDEITKMWYAKPMAPEGVKTYNPAFDITEAKYITAVITEKGIVYPPYDVNLKKLFEDEK